MTPARKKALQWLHDQGEVSALDVENKLSEYMIRRLMADDLLDTYRAKKVYVSALTDKGRRMLHGDLR